ncbi:hypothetical protein [Chitiniphilus eburneus]|uniref:hypothetical protein n=1 Tax=Chitiniphilus eburneus TaxID=2571148 RepID=UPI00145D8B9B|nr:hypothetical protein [Chitiniphilus eburneus]
MSTLSTVRRVWGMPLALSGATLFGLLACLLATGIWHVLGWLALAWPLWTVARHSFRR